MSSHYIYVQCQNCKKLESVYTGDTTTDDFDDGWNNHIYAFEDQIKELFDV